MVILRDFSWTYFSKTGDVESYLLYKESNQNELEAQESEEEMLRFMKGMEDESLD